MPCYTPISARRSLKPKPNGKHRLWFRASQKHWGEPIKLPCGRCIGCRLEHSRQWAVRCMHEASLHEDNCLVNLTYSDEHLPPSRSLCKADLQKFFKRLRKKFGTGVRYFACGEYGDESARPHYHALLFNFKFPDCVFDKLSPTGCRLYRSELLEDRWRLGLSNVGDVTFKSAAYVARYCMKKAHDTVLRDADEWWSRYFGDPRALEFIVMSRRPPIANDWYKKFGAEVYREDMLVLPGGVEVKPPKYYDVKFSLTDPVTFDNIKAMRKEAAECSPDNTPERLAVREGVKMSKLNLLRRDYYGEA